MNEKILGILIGLNFGVAILILRITSFYAKELLRENEDYLHIVNDFKYFFIPPNCLTALFRYLKIEKYEFEKSKILRNVFLQIFAWFQLIGVFILLFLILM